LRIADGKVIWIVATLSQRTQHKRYVFGIVLNNQDPQWRTQAQSPTCLDA
jgi:hypothetical protein